MSREKTSSRMMVRNYCKVYQMDAETLLGRAELLHRSYRHICFTGCLDNEEYFEETFEEKKPIDVILFLENLDPSMNKTEFVRSVKEGTDKNWLIEMVEQAMTKVHKTPIEGDLYFDLLSKRYIIKSPYSEMEILEELSLSRARYYDKRWEALVMFGVCFWGGVLPNMKKTLMAS